MILFLTNLPCKLNNNLEIKALETFYPLIVTGLKKQNHFVYKCVLLKTIKKKENKARKLKATICHTILHEVCERWWKLFIISIYFIFISAIVPKKSFKL